MEWVKAILTSGQVWSAFLLLINTLLFYFWPDFPREIWASVNGFVIAILGVLGINVVKDKVETARLEHAIDKLRDKLAGMKDILNPEAKGK